MPSFSAASAEGQEQYYFFSFCVKNSNWIQRHIAWQLKQMIKCVTTECPSVCCLKTFVLGYILFIASLILIPTSYVNLNFQFTLMTWLVSTNESRKEWWMLLSSEQWRLISCPLITFAWNWFGLAELNFPIQQSLCEYDHVNLRFTCVSSILSCGANNHRC